jgi:flagellar motor switch protein FliM
MLSQAEIDALLGAVADGTLPTEDQAPTLSADGRLVKTYDFRRPAKFSNEQLRTLQAIHETVARVAAARLSSSLRGAVVIQLAGTDQLIFDDYLSQLSLPTQLVVMTSSGLNGPFMVDMDLGSRRSTGSSVARVGSRPSAASRRRSRRISSPAYSATCRTPSTKAGPTSRPSTST